MAVRGFCQRVLPGAVAPLEEAEPCNIGPPATGAGSLLSDPHLLCPLALERPNFALLLPLWPGTLELFARASLDTAAAMWAAERLVKVGSLDLSLKGLPMPLSADPRVAWSVRPIRSLQRMPCDVLPGQHSTVT